MRKYLQRQQVEKMFREDMENMKINNQDEQLKMIYWFQLLNCLYRNGGIAKRHCSEWEYSEKCN